MEVKMKNKSIGELARQWVNVKAEVERLKAQMVELEEKMLPSLESVEGGSRTNNVEGWKIVVKRPINRTIDADEWDSIKDKIPEDVWPVKTKVVPDDVGCVWLAENKPKLWVIASEAITEKPGKAGFTIEEAKE
jgi:hypothetical protein